MSADVVGYIGTFFISVNLAPQIYHIIQIKNAESISTVSVILGILSGVFMGTYGYLIDKTPIIISNIIVSSFYIVILALKTTYEKVVLTDVENDVENV